MKETLLQLINSYAAARSSGDPILQQFAAGQLTSKFQKMAVSAPVKAAKVNTTVESECHPDPVSRNLFIQ